jgi:uroporphyrinogen-III decarboxylase
MPRSSKELVQAFFATKPVDRPPFIPLIASAAAQFMQVPVQRMYSDPTTLANSLHACQGLFKYDAVVVLFDQTLEAEAFGCEVAWDEGGPPRVVFPAVSGMGDVEPLDSAIESKGRIPIVLEAAKRLVVMAGQNCAALGAVTGPVTLSRHLLGDSFLELAATDGDALRRAIEFSGRVAVALARAFGELKLDGLVVSDPDLVSLPFEHYESVNSVLKTLHNVTGFYDMPLILQTGSISAGGVDGFLGLEADAFSASGLAGTSEVPPGRLLGVPVPAPALAGTTDDIGRAVEELLAAVRGRAVFVTTEGEVPPGTPAANLHKLVQAIADGS